MSAGLLEEARKALQFAQEREVAARHDADLAGKRTSNCAARFDEIEKQIARNAERAAKDAEIDAEYESAVASVIVATRATK